MTETPEKKISSDLLELAGDLAALNRLHKVLPPTAIASARINFQARLVRMATALSQDQLPLSNSLATQSRQEEP